MRVIAALAVVLLLSGCVPTPPDASPTPSPTPTPVFASEEEALAAAEEAYAAYEAAVDQSLRTYDRDPLGDVATGQALANSIESSENFEEKGHHLEGDTSTRIVELVHPGGLLNGVGSEPMSVYACLDVSATNVLDGEGTSIVPPDRQTLFPEIVTLAFDAARSRLLVEDVEIWEGESFCG